MRRRNEILVSLITLIRKEIKRYLRIWVQTLVPPAVTMSLYFVIFGSLIGPRIGSMDGLDYIQFMIPGLIMMSVITNSYANVVSSFYSVKFQKSIEELLVSPMPNWAILTGFIMGGVTRGILIGIIVDSLTWGFFSNTYFQLYKISKNKLTATYECGNCARAVNTTCAKCDVALVDASLEIGDGKNLQIAKCANCGGKIKSPSCCGQEMSCSV